jgi:alpha-tubulin suppressor-like RCC1 family protein
MLNVLLLALPMVGSAGQASDTLEFVTLAAGGSHTCGIAKSKATYCWGSNQYGQIGDGKRTGQQNPNRSPTLVLGDHQFASLALGSRFTCGLTDQGKAYCWGYNFDGQVGDGTTTGEKFAPTAVKTDQTFESIVAGQFQVCALTGEGDAYCWGSSGSGQVGDGRSWNRQNIAEVPTKVVGGHTFNSTSRAGWREAVESIAGVAWT